MSDLPNLDELGLARVERFATLLAESPQRRISREELWSAFAQAFPGRPQGPNERRWFLAALHQLVKRGTLRMPALRGSRWERSLTPALPTSVDLIGEALSRPPADWRAFPWHPKLSWIAELPRLTVDHEAFLRKVHQGLVQGHFLEAAPLKYRSLQLTGHEKTLALFAKTRLFALGRLTLELLNCYPDAPPLAITEVGAGSCVLIFENAGPFAVARDLLADRKNHPYGWIAYGGGRCVTASIETLRRGQWTVSEIHYVGDLDPAGLDIAIQLQTTAANLALPPVRPAPGIHQAMLDSARNLGFPNGWPSSSERASCTNDLPNLLTFLPEGVRLPVTDLLKSGHRIPEEVLGPREFRVFIERDGFSARWPVLQPAKRADTAVR